MLAIGLSTILEVELKRDSAASRSLKILLDLNLRLDGKSSNCLLRLEI